MNSTIRRNETRRSLLTGGVNSIGCFREAFNKGVNAPAHAGAVGDVAGGTHGAAIGFTAEGFALGNSCMLVGAPGSWQGAGSPWL